MPVSKALVFSHPRYVPGEELGRGAQGVVVRVLDREAPATALVAKVWQGRLFRESSLRGEFALLSRLRIPGLVRAHDLGRCEKTGAPFFIENFVDGPAARDWLIQVPESARAARLLLVFTALTSTLMRLHESGFLHGDLKPVHVRIASSGQTHLPMLLDLGAAISRASVDATYLAHTPAYAAPEVCAGATPSVAADLYGLGATMFALATGFAPHSRSSRPLFDHAPWIPPGIAAIVDALRAEHPQDRPQSARDVLHRLGITGLSPTPPPYPMGRDKDLAVLLHERPPAARWIVGPSGSGKTHLVHELYTRLLLAGRDVRLVRFPAQGDLVGRLVAYLRGDASALPFTFAPDSKDKPLLILDDAHLAPDEVLSAIDAFRCRPSSTLARVAVLLTARDAPPGTETLRIGELDDPAFAALCASFGVTNPDKVRELAVASGKNPGWLIASMGAIPLEKDTLLDRVQTLSLPARYLLAVCALSAGEVPESVYHRVMTTEAADVDALAELSAAALITRRIAPDGIRYSLYSPNLMPDLVAALVDGETANLATKAWLDEPYVSTNVLLALGKATSESSLRSVLLDRAATQARTEGVRSHEVEALLTLVTTEANRSVPRLLRLERLLRDGPGPIAHARVIEWLDIAAQQDETLTPLVLRRHAEKLAREGKTTEAADWAEQARAAAVRFGDAGAAALALATRGVAALYRADWEEAEACIGQAQAVLKNVPLVDTEELARIDHNGGVVALYRGRIEEAIAAFERALATKRQLGDRAGIRSCLLNLGLALAKAKRYDDAEHVLQESLDLARSLGQTTGQGWCLVARADVCIRRKDATKAREWLAEASQLEQSLPKPIRADLLLLHAEAALLIGDGFAATKTLEQLEPAIRTSDALVDTRALVLQSRACLSQLPIARHESAKLAVRAIRRARGAKLPEWEIEAIATFRTARRKSPHIHMHKTPYLSRTEINVWPWLTSFATGISFDDAASSLGRFILEVSGAERVFFAWIDSAGQLRDARGLDLDGLPLAVPAQRIKPDVIANALRTTHPIIDRDVEAAGQRGCRLAIAGPAHAKDASRALLVLEHRFLATAFDHISVEFAQHAAILNGLLWTRHGTRQTPHEHHAGEAFLSVSLPASGTMSEEAHGQTTFFPAVERRRDIPTILGRSVPLERALVRLEAAIECDLPTLIIGETGTGKELFARALHDYGRRQDEPFVAVNCGAIPDSLFEAELFGHVRGSFTGAERARSGLLARAGKGTLFLDEIGELPLLRQATLLRVLQDRKYRPVGSDDETSFDVRIVAATNRDLMRAVEQCTFRRDLLYRLNTLEIHVPALRERVEDISDLAQLFLARAGSKSHLSAEAIAKLEAYAWPGNVRELEHVMQRLAMQRADIIDASFLPREIRHLSKQNGPRRDSSVEVSSKSEESARSEVQNALLRCQGNISRAAVLLGLTRHGLKKRMVRLGLRAPGGGMKKEI